MIHKKQLTVAGLRSCNSSFRTLTQPLPKGEEPCASPSSSLFLYPKPASALSPMLPSNAKLGRLNEPISQVGPADIYKSETFRSTILHFLGGAQHGPDKNRSTRSQGSRMERCSPFHFYYRLLLG